MTAVSHLLRDFSIRREAAEDLRFLSAEELEDERLAAFERGYGAGWEDALQSARADQAALGEAFRQSIADLGFTYYEAHAAMQREAASVVDAVFRAVLPKIAQATLAHHATGLLEDLLKSATKVPVQVIVHPDQVPSLELLIDPDEAFALEIKGDPDMPVTQAEMRFGQDVRLLDPASAVQDILEALEAFCHETQRQKYQGQLENASE